MYFFAWNVQNVVLPGSLPPKNEKVTTWMFEKKIWKLVHLATLFSMGHDPDPKTSCSFGDVSIHYGGSDSSRVPKDMIFLQEWNN